MYKKVHFKLTLLFTAVCSLILLVMSCLYTYLNYNSIYRTAFSKFQNEMNTISSNFSDNFYFSHDNIRSIEHNYNCSVYIYENDEPAFYTQQKNNSKYDIVLDAVLEKNEEEISKLKNAFKLRHSEMVIKVNREKYFSGIISVPGEFGNTMIYVINRPEKEISEFYRLCLKLTILFLCSIAVFFVFSFFFTGKLLMPLKKSQEAQMYFISAASHEIKNPVNTIISALDAVKNSDDEHREKFISTAVKEGKRLTALTEDLMTLVRTSDTNFKLSLEETALDTLLLDCHSAFLASAGKKKITLDLILPDDPPAKVNVDPGRIKQIFSILLNNAVEYTPENGKITVTYLVNSNEHCISVEDNGKGISEEDKLHIFDRFYRADRARENKSHFGLGLSIAKELTDLHHGKISVENSASGGAIFKVTLIKSDHETERKKNKSKQKKS